MRDKGLALTTRSPEFLRYRRYVSSAHRSKYGLPGPNKPLADFLKSGAWRGQRCFVIGGGPSLKGFDFKRLEGQGRIIATNRSFLDVPFADLLLAMDPDCYDYIREGNLPGWPDSWKRFKAFRGFKVWIDGNCNNMPGVLHLNNIQDPCFSKNLHNGIYGGNNTGTAALMLAAALGCSPIYLLGIDGKHDKKTGKSHYHKGYPKTQHEAIANSFVSYFHEAKKALAKRGIQVINLNRRSAVKCFPFGDVDKVLRGTLDE